MNTLSTNPSQPSAPPPTSSASQSGQATTDLDVAIVGGGVSGLATAYFIEQGRRDHSLPPLRVAVYEAEAWPGGKVQTETVASDANAPFIIEAGPDSFLTQKPWALNLARALGMDADLMGTNDHRRKVFVLQGKRLLPMPEGLQLIVPTRIMPFATSPLLSPLGKLRMALDLILPARRDEEDETLADFITRRLGREALDKLAEPLMSGIYSAEADRQSILATFPRFRELERQHGSLIRGILAAGRARQAAAGQPGKPDGKRLSAFVTPVQGTGELIRRLVAALYSPIYTGMGVRRLEALERATDDREKSAYRLHLSDGSHVTARAVVLAVPADAAATLLGPLAPRSSAHLSTIRHVSTVTLTLAYAPGKVDHPMDGFGVVIPHSEQRRINAITWTSSKFDRRAPDGHRLIRVFLGGSRNPQVLEHDDDELLQIAQSELAAIMGIQAAPLFHRLFRWVDASPQYDVGHLKLVDAIEDGLPVNVFVTGSPYRGIGIPDCVHQAERTANQTLASLAGALTEDGATA